MKSFFIKASLACMMLMGAVNANAQFDLSSLGKVITNGLTSVISGKNNVTVETITGTWNYYEPAITFESDNLLKQAGGKIASAALEKKLSAQFQKAGIKAGKFKMQFDEDGKFYTIKNNKKTASGTYTIDGEKIQLRFLLGVASLSGYAQIQNGSLMLTFDSTKLLKLISIASKFSGSAALSTISSIAGTYEGMKCGMTFKKQ